MQNLDDKHTFVKTLINRAPVGIFVVQDGKFRLVNPGFQQLTGFHQEELLHKDSFTLVVPEYREKLREDAIRQLKGESYIPYEFPFVTKSGQTKWAIETVASIQYAGKRAILGYFMDITAQKRAEEALRRSSETFRALLNATPESVLLLDPQGAVLAGNEVAAQRLGPSLNELVGSCIFDFLPPEVARQRKACLEEVFHSGRLLRFEDTQSGRSYDNHCHPIFDDTGKVAGFAILSVDITELKDSSRKLQESHEKLRKALCGTVSTLASALEMRDPYTAGHQQRVTQLACAVATEMGLQEDRIEGLQVAGTLHDIGKITIPAEILSRPAKLGEHEMGLVRNHAQASYDILREVEFPWPVAKIILQHHERLDGSGYPSGLKGGEILLEARILAVADVVEAMASHRPYRPALGIEKALEEISQNQGVLYDPEVVEACIKIFTEKNYKFNE